MYIKGVIGNNLIRVFLNSSVASETRTTSVSHTPSIAQDRQKNEPSANGSYLTETMWHSVKSLAIRRLGWGKISLRQESQSAVIIYSLNKYMWNTFYVLEIESKSFHQCMFPQRQVPGQSPQSQPTLQAQRQQPTLYIAGQMASALREPHNACLSVALIQGGSESEGWAASSRNERSCCPSIFSFTLH